MKAIIVILLATTALSCKNDTVKPINGTRPDSAQTDSINKPA